MTGINTAMMPARRMVKRQALFDLCRKACLLASGLDEGFHDADAGNDFLDQRTEGGGLILDRGGERFQPAAEEFRHKDEQRDKTRIKRQSRQFIARRKAMPPTKVTSCLALSIGVSVTTD